MNGDDQQGPSMNEFSPSWMRDGLDIVGEQNYPDFSSNQAWDTDPYTIGTEPGDDYQPPGGAASCMSDAGDPPDMGTWILGSVDGTCQWIDTTDCS